MKRRKKKRDYTTGAVCPSCHNGGTYLERGDLHRSTGRVPCYQEYKHKGVWITCLKGKPTRLDKYGFTTDKRGRTL